MKIEFPQFYNASVVNQKLKATISLLNHAAACLGEGNNVCTMLDVRKALTNHLLKKKNNQWALDDTLTTGTNLPVTSGKSIRISSNKYSKGFMQY
jgi:hypothetical protein